MLKRYAEHRKKVCSNVQIPIAILLTFGKFIPDMKHTLQLTHKNLNQNGSKRWAVLRDGVEVGGVIRGNYPFAEYRLIMSGAETIRFKTTAALLEHLNVK